MNAQQLRNSILQEAIEGRLVPQDPNDEPASVLLDKIRKEKARLVKEGKLKKKDLEETPISEDEKPFDIPNTWEWCRLGDVGSFERGNGIKRDETFDCGYPCVRYGEMYTKYKYAPTFEKTVSFTSKSVFEKCRKAHKGDLFMALTGENKQDISLAAQYVGDEEIAVGGDLCHFTLIEAYGLFFVYLINSTYFSSKKEILATGDIIVHISTDKLASIPIPLPPLAEQKRIVAKIEELLPKVEEYGKAQEALDKLNKELPERLKKSILQVAISGRLVPQDPNDEPTSVLLERIREEKKRLFKAGLLKKKEITDRVINENEVPFSLPDGWLWTKIDNVAFVTKLAGFEYSKYIADNLVSKEKGVPLFKGKNVQNGKIVYEFEAFIPIELSNELKRSQINKKCLLTPYVGTIGNIGIHDKKGLFHLGSNVGKIEFYNGDSMNILEEYVKYYLMSSYGYDELTKYKKATAQESISIEAIRDVFIPLPPLAEQKRIVAKIEELFAEIDKLK